MGVERAEKFRDNPMNPQGVYPNERN